MGKTIVKHEDVDRLFVLIGGAQDEYGELTKEEFHEVVEEIFGVTLPKDSDIPEKE